MAAKVDVIIKGLAICYKKVVDGKNVWRVLFPFDANCHRVKFNADPGSGSQELGAAGNNIRITTVPEGNKAESSPRFDNSVFDLTSNDTHPQVAIKYGWQKEGILLTIENIRLDVEKPLQLRPKPGHKELELILTHGNGVKKKNLGETAYSIIGTIRLNAQGSKVRVTNKKEGTETEELIFESPADQDCTLTFNNDCEESTPGLYGDMEMFYRLLHDPKAPQEKFLVESRDKPGGRIIGKGNDDDDATAGFGPDTGGENLVVSGDKPCLSAQVTKSGNLP